MRNSRKVLKAIKRFDLFEKPVQLLIKRDEGHKTVFGAILTITLVVIMLIQMISQLKSLNDRSNPQSFFTEVYHHAPDYQKWSPNNFTIGFSLQDSTYATYIDESVYIVKAILQVKSTQVYLFKAQFRQNGVSTTLFDQVPVNLTTCNPSVLKQPELFNYFTQNLDMPTNYCIDWNSVDHLYIQGNWDSDTFVSLQLLFSTCTSENRRPGGPECKSDEEIKKQLKGNYFISLDQYKPFEPIGQDYYTSTSNQITKEIDFYMMPVTVNTDYGLITEDIQSLKTIRFDRNTELMDLSAGVEFLKVVFRMETTEQVYNRSYQKITLILSNLGGLWQVLFSIALMIQKPVSELSYRIQIINSLFNFEGSQEKEFQQNRSKFYKERSEFNLEIAQKSNPTSPRELLDQADDNILNQKDYSNPDNNSRYEKSRKQAKQRLKSIVAKQHRMQEMESDGDLKKIKSLTKDITLSLKKYFRLVSKKLQLNLFEYVYFLRCLVKKDENKAHQIDFASDRMDKSIDILYLIKKIQEIDKLKTILLTKDQIKLFDYLPKPTIPINPAKLNQDNQYFSILRPVKTDYQRANEAKFAFQEIMKDPFNPINKNLISCMDENIINLLCINLDEQQKVSQKIDESSLRDEREDEQVQVNEIYISKP
ncbi:hypothetical protein pb186bvf_003691 [Paramecium bursaria]